MRRINLKEARSQLEELKRLQGKKDTIFNVVARVESSGQISATLYRGLPKSGKVIAKTFPSLRDLLEFPGITDETNLLLDDICGILPSGKQSTGSLPLKSRLNNRTPTISVKTLIWMGSWMLGPTILQPSWMCLKKGCMSNPYHKICPGSFVIRGFFAYLGNTIVTPAL